MSIPSTLFSEEMKTRRQAGFREFPISARPRLPDAVSPLTGGRWAPTLLESRCSALGEPGPRTDPGAGEGDPAGGGPGPFLSRLRAERGLPRDPPTGGLRLVPIPLSHE